MIGMETEETCKRCSTTEKNSGEGHRVMEDDVMRNAADT